MKPVPTGVKSQDSRVKRMDIQRHTAVAVKFSAGDSQEKFVVEEGRDSEL
jgi:hypothetical protein